MSEMMKETSNYRLLHTMIRVKDLEKSIEFYSKHLGMEVLRKKDFPGGKFTNVFMGYGEETSNTVLELTYNWGENTYDKGNAYGHIAIEVEDIYGFCGELENQGAEVYRKPGPVKGGQTIIAFVRDPDGYAIELIQAK